LLDLSTSIVERKFPAAPAITKSIRPNSWMVCSTAVSIDFKSLTSAEIARHFAPLRSASISFAIDYGIREGKRGKDGRMSTSDDCRIRAERDESFNLDRANRSSSASAEDDLGGLVDV
jgi:hypothetical protein